ncbi:hepatic lectin-like isoform X2 [Protopterus annectens]|uniref:hepatic lectin-like isoform X2 n=1 Tax=Protopterus annectens TaxID=7888 RepID=UPI001CFBCA79|nr:hepatic lectin-like isoform X2 [Protopterus annectens]
MSFTWNHKMEDVTYADIKFEKKNYVSQGIQLSSKSDAKEETVEANLISWTKIAVLLLCLILLSLVVFLAILYIKQVETIKELRSNYSELSKKMKWLQKEVCSPHNNGSSCGAPPLEWIISETSPRRLNFKNKIYYFSEEFLSWTASRDRCLAIESDLVVINSREEQEFLNNARSSNYYGFWIGLTDEAEEGSWQWIDGTNYTTTEKFWESGEPNNNINGNRKGADCVILIWKRDDLMTWGRNRCLNTKKFICEKEYKRTSI